MNYNPHTEQEVKDMLSEIGLKSVDELFRDIPASLKTKSFNLPAGLSEFEVYDRMKKLSEQNKTQLICFLGGGFYDHYIPSVVDHLANRAEFYTAYTPYQPEAAQGTLQSLFEYQSAICALTGLDVSNASLYDGGTALGEAVLMSMRITGKSRILLDEGVSPVFRRVLHSYIETHQCQVDTIKAENYSLNRKELEKQINDETACFVFQNPNFFGTVEDFTEVVKTVQAKGALAVQVAYPLALSVLKTPGEIKADIAIGDGQSLGNPLSFGGPYFGFIAADKKHIRNMPGRIVGETVDKNGKRGFVLTLQAREQHIKRAKATSNICSNQSLCAVRALIYMCAVGKAGLRETALQNLYKTAYMRELLSKAKGITVKSQKNSFNELVIETKGDAALVLKKMLEKGFFAGILLSDYYPELKNQILLAVTEKRSKNEIEAYVKALEAAQ